jgi:hypothetical protein
MVTPFGHHRQLYGFHVPHLEQAHVFQPSGQPGHPADKSGQGLHMGAALMNSGARLLLRPDTDKHPVQWIADHHIFKTRASQETARQEDISREAAIMQRGHMNGGQEAAALRVDQQIGGTKVAMKLQRDGPTGEQEAAALIRNQSTKKEDAAILRRVQEVAAREAAAAEKQFTVQADLLAWMAAKWAETARQLAESSHVWPHKVVYYGCTAGDM